MSVGDTPFVTVSILGAVNIVKLRSIGCDNAVPGYGLWKLRERLHGQLKVDDTVTTASALQVIRKGKCSWRGLCRKVEAILLIGGSLANVVCDVNVVCRVHRKMYAV